MADDAKKMYNRYEKQRKKIFFPIEPGRHIELSNFPLLILTTKSVRTNIHSTVMNFDERK